MPTLPAQPPVRPGAEFMIVAIGASAGGLDALRDLFGAATVDARIAYVVVTHLPSHHVSYLADLLGRAGVLPAHELAEGERLQGGRVHVMPPGRLMSLRDGVVRFEQEEPDRSPAPKPIDFFMVSLAEQAGDRSVGIVLSGTDHDGTVGLKAIKDAGGLTMVQIPATAQFPGMPDSAIAAGVADQVLAPHAMPAALASILGHWPSDVELGAAGEDEVAGPEGAKRLNTVLAVVLARTGNDFRLYRPAMLRRRLRRRMALKGCDRLDDYMTLLDSSPDEAAALSSEFLIGVTDFFRDPGAWQELERSVLPALFAEHSADNPPWRVWTPGCSTGEESYSIAMLMQEQLDERGDPGSVQVFGTDIDLDALAVARHGIYPESIESTVTAPRLARFFNHRNGHYAVRKSLRDAVMFAPQNLVRDTPFSRLDMVLCRNVLMYFDPALQERVLQLFHFALKPGGLLWLGKAESLGSHGTLFEPVSSGMRLFRRVGGRAQLPRGYARAGNAAPGWQRRTVDRPAKAGEILRRHLADRQVDAAVLIDRDGRALHFRGDTARFLAPQGDATLEALRLVRPELQAALRSVMRAALSEGQASLRRTKLDGRPLTLDAEPVQDSDNRGLAVLVFTAAPASADEAERTGGGTAGAQDAQEMEDNRRELALALEDSEHTNEELRLAGEEASSLNEELQSSNEELESSREELQSLNEELSTVNAQLEDKVVEVARQADDVANLLDSTHIATVLLDPQLQIRRFTPAAAALFNLRDGDEGRLLSDLSSRLDDPGFAADARAVLESREPSEVEVRASDGAFYLRRILPFRTVKGDIEGAVATFVDITPLRNAARQTRQLLATLEDSNDAVFSYEPQGRILSWNNGAKRTYGYPRDQALAGNVFALVPADAHETTREMIARACSDGPIGPENVDRLTSDGRVVRVSMTVSALRDDHGRVYALLSTERDVTERLRIDTEMRFRRLADDIPALLRVEDVTGMTQFVNRACAEFTKQSREALVGRGWLEFVHPQDRDAYLVQHVDARQARTRMEGDVRLLRGDGVYRWMRSISVPHMAPDGQFAGYVSLMLDVEDRKQAEAALVTADHRKDEFLAMLAHELRNPLAPIVNATRLIAETASDERTAWAVGVVERQTGVLSTLLDGLLDVARIARGKAVLKLAPVELGVVVARAVEMSTPSIQERGQRLNVATVPDHLIVEGDLVRLTQVLANLLNNASKYTDRGGEIHVEAAREGAEGVIRVTDNGVGLAPEMLPLVFDLFTQADRTLDRAKGGLGLGLTLVRQLVELHHGSVQAASAGLGKGSTFTVRLPLLANLPAVSAVRKPAPPMGDARHIMVVDDNVDSAQTLALVLELQGHEVSVAHSGPEAISVLQAVAHDIVILDIGLPGIDGYDVARILRGRADTAKSTLIAVTGYGQPEDVHAARDAGFDHHFRKPVDLDELSACIARAPRQPASSMKNGPAAQPLGTPLASSGIDSA